MLRHISIRNYHLIDELELELHQGFTVLTGETGSGKSMLIDAIQLALGQRADPASLRDPQKRCYVELEVDASHLQNWFAEKDIPFDLISNIRRQIDVGGRSRAFVNDTPVRLEVLKELAAKLLHIHSQHQSRLLNDSATMLRMLDRSAGLSALLSKYEQSFSSWKGLKKAFIALTEQTKGPALDVDYLRFQLDELTGAQLKGSELEGLDSELRIAESAEDIIRVCSGINDALDGTGAILSAMHELGANAAKLAANDRRMAAFAERLNSSYLELKDLNTEVEDHGRELVVDESRAEWLRERIDTINRLLEKHRLQQEKELLELTDSISAQLTKAENADKRSEELQTQIARIEEELRDIGMELSACRTQALPGLEKNITERLQLLGIPKARFRMELKSADPHPLGLDRVQCLFAADPDRPLGELHKIASGGELSRVMLAMISPTAKAMGVGTIIFDEVDTGVSGEVADKVGAIINNMAKGTQIIAISHLPQVASKANNHLYVSKVRSDSGTVSAFRVLNTEERVRAVAEMLSGSNTSTAALENARELLSSVVG